MRISVFNTQIKIFTESKASQQLTLFQHPQVSQHMERDTDKTFLLSNPH